MRKKGLLSHYPEDVQQFARAQLMAVGYMLTSAIVVYFVPQVAKTVLLSFIGGSLIAMLMICVITRRKKEKTDVWEALRQRGVRQ